MPCRLQRAAIKLSQHKFIKNLVFFVLFSLHLVVGLHCTSPKYNGGFSTVDPRRTPKMNHNKKFFRKSSLPLDNSTLMGPMTRTERINVVLDCTHGSGVCLGVSSQQSGGAFVVTKVLHESVADRSGCIQKGDRIVSVNKLYNLDIQLIRQILRDTPTMFQQQQNLQGTTHWVELEIEFDTIVDDSARGIFNIKLLKTSRTSGLGVTVNGETRNLVNIFTTCTQHQLTGSSHGAFVVTDIKPGSPAHRASVKVGDLVLAIDSHPIQHFNVDILLKENKNDCVTLTVRRNSIADYLYDTQSRQNAVTYANFDPTANNFGNYNNL